MSSFFNKGGIILPKPSQVARTKIRNLYEDGYPGAAPRTERTVGPPIISVRTSASPWHPAGFGYRLDSSTHVDHGTGDEITTETYGDHEFPNFYPGVPHRPGPATGLLGGGGDGFGITDDGRTSVGAPCPDPANADPSDAPWSPDDCK